MLVLSLPESACLCLLLFPFFCLTRKFGAHTPVRYRNSTSPYDVSNMSEADAIRAKIEEMQRALEDARKREAAEREAEEARVREERLAIEAQLAAVDERLRAAQARWAAIEAEEEALEIRARQEASGSGESKGIRIFLVLTRF